MALAAIDRLADTLVGYHAYHATRADLLRRLGQFASTYFRRCCTASIRTWA